MAVKEGVVWSVSTKAWNGKTLYSIKLDGDDNYYRVGEIDPEVGKGDTIKFAFTEIQKGKYTNYNIDLDKFKVVKKASKNSPTKVGPSSSDEYWAAKEERDIDTQKKISYAGAYNSALTLATLLEQKGMLKFNKTAKSDVLITFVKGLAEDIFKDIQTVADRFDIIMLGEGADIPVQVTEEASTKAAPASSTEDSEWEDNSSETSGEADDDSWDD